MLKILLLTCLIGQDPDECIPQTAQSVVVLGVARTARMCMAGGQSVIAGSGVPVPAGGYQKLICEKLDDGT